MQSKCPNSQIGSRSVSQYLEQKSSPQLKYSFSSHVSEIKLSVKRIFRYFAAYAYVYLNLYCPQVSKPSFSCHIWTRFYNSSLWRSWNWFLLTKTYSLLTGSTSKLANTIHRIGSGIEINLIWNYAFCFITAFHYTKILQKI